MSTLSFRNVEVDARATVREWPPEAIETALDRGSLTDWRRLAAEIRRSPWGATARTVEEVVSWKEHPGVDALMAEVLRHARADVTRRGRQRWADHLITLRKQAGLTLREVAELAGTSASRLSDYERAKVSPTTDALARIEHAVALARGFDRDGAG
jgi:hypothetical protein